METSPLLLTFMITLLSSTGARTSTASRTSPTTKNSDATSTEFIRARCNATDYPQMCVTTLSSYASTIGTSPVQLANTALSVSLTNARSTAAMMTRLSTGGRSGRMSRKGAEAVRDCVDGLGDSVEYLGQSLTAMRRMKGKEVRLRINDAQSWVSTALTDDRTCMDEFAADVSTRSAVRGQVVKVARLTSNALALIGAVAAIEKP